MTGIHVLTIAIGFTCTFAYMLSRDVQYLGSFFKTWFDLTQQFFSLALGAYPLVKLGMYFKTHQNLRGFDWVDMCFWWGAIAIGAVFFGGLWATEKYFKGSRAEKTIHMAAFIVGLVVIFEILYLGDGAQSILTHNSIYLYNKVIELTKWLS